MRETFRIVHASEDTYSADFVLPSLSGIVSQSGTSKKVSPQPHLSTQAICQKGRIKRRESVLYASGCMYTCAGCVCLGLSLRYPKLHLVPRLPQVVSVPPPDISQREHAILVGL